MIFFICWTLISWLQTLPKADGPKGWVLLFLKSYCKFSKFSFKNLTKLKPQKLNQTSASKSWPNFSFKIFDLTSNPASKFWPNFNFNWPIFSHKVWTKIYFKILTKSQPQSFEQQVYFKILTKPQVQYCDQNSGSTSLPNLSFKTSTELLSTLSSISTSRIFELASSKVRVTSVKSTKQQWVSQWKWQGYTMIGLGSDINEIVGNDNGIIAHWWTLCYLLFFDIFQHLVKSECGFGRSCQGCWQRG